MPALSFASLYEAPPAFLAAPLSAVSVAKHYGGASHSALPPPPQPGAASSSAASFHHSARRVSHSPAARPPSQPPSQSQSQSPQQPRDLLAYAHSPPLPHSQPSHAHLHAHSHSHAYSPPDGSFQRALSAQGASTIAPSYHVAAAQPQQQPHSPTHAGAFRPVRSFKPTPVSPPSALRPGIVYSFPAPSLSSSGSPSSPVPVAASPSHPTILIHPSSYSPTGPYPRLLSSPVPHSPVDAVVRPLAVRRTGSPPLPSSALLGVPGLTSQSSCPTCSHHSHSHAAQSQLHTRSLSNGPPPAFLLSSGSPQYHTVQSYPQHSHSPHAQQSHRPPPHQQHPPYLAHQPSQRLSAACLAAGCAYPVSPRSEHRMATSDDEDSYSYGHHSVHSHLSLPSSSSSSSPSLGQPRYSSASAPSAPPPHPHYVVAAASSYGYSPPVSHSHLQVLSSQPPGRAALPSHVQYSAPPGTAYTVQSIPIATLSPQSASPSSASSTSSSVSGPFPSAASSTSAGSSSSLSSPPSPRAAAKSKRSAAHMREFVRNYFLRHSASLVNKDLTSISAELQAAYEKETAHPDAGNADSVADRKPVFCRTFIQKVARSLGFILTLHFGLVDKRMKHLMKIRKRGKKNSKRHAHGAAAVASHTSTASAVDRAQPDTAGGGDRGVHAGVKPEPPAAPHSRMQGDERLAAGDDEDDVAAAAHRMEEMAAAREARASPAAALKAEEDVEQQLAHGDRDRDGDDESEEEEADEQAAEGEAAAAATTMDA